MEQGFPSYIVVSSRLTAVGRESFGWRAARGWATVNSRVIPTALFSPVNLS
jgi:hypothetical protein